MQPKDTPPTTPTLLFTISFQPEQKAISFVGNIPPAQVMVLLQQIILQQQREEIKKELQSDHDKPTEPSPPHSHAHS